MTDTNSTPAVAKANDPLVHVYTTNILQQLGCRPSSGALPTSDRLAAANLDNSFIACQNKLKHVKPIYPSSPSLKLGRQGAYCSDFIPLTANIRDLDGHTHQTEIQNVAARSIEGNANELIVGSVDSYGVGQISRVRTSNDSNDLSIISSFTLRPPSIVEDGWHGLSLHPTQAERSVVASYFGRSLAVYHEERLMQTLFLSTYPTSTAFFEAPQFNEPLLVVNEGNSTTIWDLRLNNSVGQVDNVSKGAIQRLQDTTGDLFALDTHKGAGIIATGGVDKQVTVFDGRKWQVSGRWKNVLKYEIMSLRFTSFSSNYLYVTGLDHEVYCGAWNNQSLNQRNLERQAFRGDSRWIGISRTEGADHLVGLTDSAQLYVLQHAHLQNGPLNVDGTASAATSSIVTQARQRRDQAAAERRERVAAGLSAATPEELVRKKEKMEKKAAVAAAAAATAASTTNETNRKRKEHEESLDDQPPEQKQKL